MNLPSGDLGFLTKFMNQFKKIKNIDMGNQKIEKGQMGELTEAIKHNPFIQEFKFN